MVNYSSSRYLINLPSYCKGNRLKEYLEEVEEIVYYLIKEGVISDDI